MMKSDAIEIIIPRALSELPANWPGQFSQSDVVLVLAIYKLHFFAATTSNF